MYEALTHLGSVGWSINGSILDVARHLYKEGIGYKHLKLPPAGTQDLPLPAIPQSYFRVERTRKGQFVAHVRTLNPREFR